MNKTELLNAKEKTTMTAQSNNYYFWNTYNNKIANKADSNNIIGIKDGDIVLTTSHTARRETATINRGWRAMFRVSMQTPEKENPEGEVVKQQYVSIPNASKGW